MSDVDPIGEAISRAGSEEKLGKAIGYSQHAIWKAKMLGRVSGEMAIKIFVWSEGSIPLQSLRPDLFSPAMTEGSQQ